MNLSAASLLLLTTIPGALSANKVCHLFIYVAHTCVCSAVSGVGRGESNVSLDCHCSLVYDDDDDLIANDSVFEVIRDSILAVYAHHRPIGVSVLILLSLVIGVYRRCKVR